MTSSDLERHPETEAELRAGLLTDPRAALLTQGVRLPDDRRLVVFEEADGSLVIDVLEYDEEFALSEPLFADFIPQQLVAV
jgi:hypothetical protein